MSRRPKPTALKELEGNPGGRPLNDREPKPTLGCPERPKGLSFTAKREWANITKQLAELGVLAVTDGKALAMYCSAYGDWEEADRKCKKDGSWIEVPGAFGNVWKLAPWFNARCICAKLMKSFLIEFGLTPASRSKLKVEHKPEAPDFPTREEATRVAEDAVDLSAIDETKIM